MKGSGYLNWMRRLIVLGAVVAGVTAASAGAMRPVEIGGTPTGNTNLPTVVSRPPDVSDVAARLSPTTAFGLRADGQRLQAVALAYENASRAQGVKADGLRYQAIAQAYRDSTQVSAPDAFERYASAHPYGLGVASGTEVSVPRPPDVADAAVTAAQGGGSVIQTSGFDWTDWAIGIGTGLGLVLLLGIGFAMSRQMRHDPQPA